MCVCVSVYVCMCACDCVCVCMRVCVCVYQYYSLHDPTIAGRCAMFVRDTRVELVPVAHSTSVSATSHAQTLQFQFSSSPGPPARIKITFT